MAATPTTETVGNCDVAACVSRAVLVHLAGKWAALILRTLSRGERRYSEIRWTIEGISEKMLAQTLDVLERDGLIARTSHPVVPPRVEYALTEGGRALAERFFELFRWIGANVETYTEAQQEYDSRRASA